MDSSKALVVRSVPEEDDGEGGHNTRTRKELTEDLIVEIFARLPVKSLIRFRCISKHWYNLIFSPNFMSLHFTHCQINNKIITLRLYSFCQNLSGFNGAQRNTNTILSFRFGEDDLVQELMFNHHHTEMTACVNIVGCFNGVVCLSLSPRPQTYALWNPATRQVREIGDFPTDGTPPPPLDSDFYEKLRGSNCSGFCFDQVTNSFKIAQIKLTGTEAGETRAQVNVFSTTTSSWTSKYIDVPYPIGVSGFNKIRSAICVNGYLHWHIVIYHPGQRVGDMYILSYDIINEEFERIEMPSRDVFAQYSLDSYRGSLAIFVHRRKRTGSIVIDLWVMNDCGGSRPHWSKILTCKPSCDVSSVVGFFRKDGVDFILMYSSPNLCNYAYDPLSGETKVFWKREYVMNTYPYCESAASLY